MGSQARRLRQLKESRPAGPLTMEEAEMMPPGKKVFFRTYKQTSRHLGDETEYTEQNGYIIIFPGATWDDSEIVPADKPPTKEELSQISVANLLPHACLTAAELADLAMQKWDRVATKTWTEGPSLELAAPKEEAPLAEAPLAEAPPEDSEEEARMHAHEPVNRKPDETVFCFCTEQNRFTGSYMLVSFDKVLNLCDKRNMQKSVPSEQELKAATHESLLMSMTDNDIVPSNTGPGLAQLMLKNWNSIYEHMCMRYDGEEKSHNGKLYITMKHFHIYIQHPAGHYVMVEVRGADDILSVKKKLEERENVPVDCQKLLCDEQLLADDKTIKDYAINGDSSIYLTVVTKPKPKGKGKGSQ